ncbi:hypothetical protein NEOKW01_2150, partial [Nematocida sp. AWRm80]
ISSTFSGTENEDISTWILDAKFILQLHEMEGIPALRQICSALRDEAFAYARESLSANPYLQPNDLLKLLETRFASGLKIKKVAQKFLQGSIPETIDDYFMMMRDASYLSQHNYLSVAAIVDQIIIRSPAELRTTLWQVASDLNNVYELSKAVEKILPLAYSQEGSMAHEQVNANKMAFNRNNNINNNSEKKWCALHGKTYHDTDSCITIQTLRKRQSEKKAMKSQFKKEFIKDDSNYSFTSKCFNSESKCNNPFVTKAIVQKRIFDCILDTGADTSFIPRHCLLNNISIIPTNTQALAANGSKIKIIGKVRNLSITVNNTDIQLTTALITDDSLSTILIGADALTRHNEILTNILAQESTPCIANSVQYPIQNILTKFAPLFSDNISQSTLCTVIKHNIKTTDEQIIRQSNGRLPVFWEEEIQKEVSKLLKNGIIRYSDSGWASRINPVKKKDGSLRLCIDYRALNKVTIKDAYPIPRIDEIVTKLRNATIFTVLDATSGYHQIELSEEDKCKTAFSFKGMHYEFNRMPFGLSNAPATFQRAMNIIFNNKFSEFVAPYFDDIIIFSENMKQHQNHLEQVFHRLKTSGIYLNNKKCKFFKSEVKILGNIISKGEIRPDPEKITAIKNYPLPKDISELRSFLGIINYCREYVTKFADHTADLYALLKNESKKSKKTIEWNENLRERFNTVKQIITQTTKLSQPDFNKVFILTTDASDKAIGAILAQKDHHGKERVISTFSKILDSTQKNYGITDRELLAVVKSIEHYRHFLIGKEFILRTDHKCLIYMNESKDQTSRLMRWSMKLAEYQFIVEYIKGEDNAADGFSRAYAIQMDRDPKIKNITNSGMIKEILKEYHLTSGHGSATAMKYLIKKKYYWKSMFSDIDKYTQSCEICQQSGKARINTENRIIESKFPNQIWEIDIIGRLPETGKHNKFILVIIDHYTKWAETFAINAKTSKMVTSKLTTAINKHGTPFRIISDQGCEFNSNEVSRFAETHNIKWEFASPAHHTTIGAVERAIQTIFNKIRKLNDFKAKNWDQKLEQATLAYNISYQRAIGTSPFILNHLTEPNLEIDKKTTTSEFSYNKTQILNKRDLHWKKYASNNIPKGKIKIDDQLRIGDEVLIYRDVLGDEFKNRWSTGYTIKEIII